MKKLILLSNNLPTLAVLFLCSCVLTSCNDGKDIYQGSNHTTDLVIPDGFEWNNFENVILSVSAPVTSRASIYTDENCSEECLIAGLHLTADKENKVELNIPTSCKQLYVKYPTADGNKIVHVNIMANSRAATGTVVLPDLSEFDGGDDPTIRNLTYLVNKGTAVFEDNWPNTGDYDFNDAVVEYSVTSYISQGSSSNPSVYDHERMEVKLTVRAVGGLYPSAVGFTIQNKTKWNDIEFRQKYIQRYEKMGQTVNGLTVKLANEGKIEDPPVIWIEGLQNLKRDGKFFNTEQNDGNAVTIDFAMYCNLYNNEERASAFAMATSALNQDIFIRNSSGREIHLKGYAPTSQYTAYNKDATTATDGTVMSGNFYCSSEGFVWGMKLPSGFRYPKEQIDIREAYPTTFAAWVTSGGTDGTAWYQFPVGDKVW